MNDRSVAIIVPTLNRRALLSRCLANLASLHGEGILVVVVDNGSSDGTSAMVRAEHPTVHLIREETNQGVSGGRNAGIRYARADLQCDLFMFMDDDATLAPDALAWMRRTLERDPGIGLVTPKRYVEGHANLIGSAGGHDVNFYTGVIKNIGAGEIDRGQFDEERDVRSAGGIALVRAAVFERIGLYDERFNPYGWEDVDLSLRARASGFRIRYQPRALAFHAGGKLGRRRATPAYERSKTKNYIWLVRKHATFPQKCALVVVLPVRALAAVVRELLRGNAAAGISILSGGLQAFGIGSRRDK